MAVFARVKAGDVLYDYCSQRAGNTTMRRKVNFKVAVREIDHEAGTALVSWNDNTPKVVRASQFKHWRRSPGKEYDPFSRLSRIVADKPD